MTTVYTGIPVQLPPLAALDGAWATKADAVAALGVLRGRGLNVEDSISAHRADTGFGRVWVLARPDALAEFTLVMRGDGSWLEGRLTDDYRPAAEWQSTGRAFPVTFTHVVRTVQAAERGERYRSKSNGSCGRYVRNDDAVAVCTCGWRGHGVTRAEARMLARGHREKTGAAPVSC